MANPAIVMPEVHGVRADVHVIPDEGTDVASDPRSRPLPPKKHLRPSDLEGAPSGTGVHHAALDSLRSLGNVAHTLTASLITQEALELNRTLLDIQHCSSAKRQRKEGFLEPPQPTLQATSDSLAPHVTSCSCPGRKEICNKEDSDSNTHVKLEEPEANALWHRVNRNRRMAAMLRDFEVLQKLLIAEITDMVREGER
jgi:hypothetical protein